MGAQCPLECEILTSTIWALHGKNEVKSRWCPLGRSHSAASNSMGRIHADIALESWLLKFWPYS